MANSQLTTVKSHFAALEGEVEDLVSMAALAAYEVLEAGVRPSEDEMERAAFAVAHLRDMIEAFRDKYLAALGYKQDRAA